VSAILAGAALLLLLYLISFLAPSIGTRDRIVGGVVVLILIVFAVVYESKRETNADRDFMTVEAFVNGKIVDCGGVKVSKENYNYISGTNTFTGKPDSTVSMQRYSVGECRVLE